MKHSSVSKFKITKERAEWFGNQPFCEKLGSLYSDNSLEKLARFKKINQEKSIKLLDQYSKVNSNLQLHKELNSKVELFSQELSSYYSSISQLENERIAMEKAAIFIQKHVKGYLTRLKYSQVIHKQALIDILKKLYKKHENELRSSSLFFMYHFGRNLDQAVRTIQKSLRIFLFKQKLKRFGAYYEMVLFQRDKQKMQTLTRNSFVLFARFKLTHTKFLRNREKRLKKIRRKLAIISIKIVLQREKISLKNLKIGIRKYKKRITLGLVKHEAANEEESLTNRTEEELKLARMKQMIEFEEAKRKKIKLGKISYKIPKPKYFSLKSRIPLNESCSSSSSLKSNKELKRTLPVLTPEPLKPKPQKFSYNKNNYLGTTQSFQFAVSGSPWLKEPDQNKPKIQLEKIRKTIYKPTKISALKVNKKKVFLRAEKPSWSSNTTVNDKYTPSIFGTRAKEEAVKTFDRGKANRKILSSDLDKYTKTVYTRKYLELIPFTPTSILFEEALPELSKISKLYSERGGQTRKAV